MRTPITVNFNDKYELDQRVLDAIKDRANQNRVSLSKAAMLLIARALDMPMPEEANQPDLVDGLIETIAELQSRIHAMGNRIQELSERQPVVIATPQETGELLPIAAIGESVVYDTTQNRESVPISDEFKKAVIEVASKRARGMGQASSQIEAPTGARRGS